MSGAAGSAPIARAFESWRDVARVATKEAQRSGERRLHDLPDNHSFTIS